MAEAQARRGAVLVVRADQPLIGIPVEEEGQEVTRYFVDDEEAERALGQDGVQRALSAIGAWSHLDWDEAERELDRIRHESTPTPPVDLDDVGGGVTSSTRRSSQRFYTAGRTRFP